MKRKVYKPTKEEMLTESELLIILESMREDWRRIVFSLLEGNETSAVEDIIQAAYVKLHRLKLLHKIYNYDTKDVNTSYMYLTLRSVTNDYHNAKQKHRKGFLTYDNDVDGTYDDADTVLPNEAMSIMIDKMNDVINNNVSWYDRQLFRLYTDTGMSMKKLATEVGISKTSINTSIQTVKTAIREALAEDWEDYKNEDFDKII